MVPGKRRACSSRFSGRIVKSASWTTFVQCSPVPLKVPESLVLSEIGSFTSRPSDPYQFAYKAKRSTLHAVSWLAHTINAHLYKGCKAFKAVLLDFSNAFNTLPRQGLLDKLAATNPPQWLMKWVHNYHTGRSQYAPVNNKTYSVIPKNCDVLQGAVLSPLFSLFIPPIFTLNHWLPFLNTQMTSSSATLVKIPKAFSQ